MIDVTGMKIAVDDLVSAAFAGDSWQEPLGRLAVSAGARDAVLMRNVQSRLVSAMVTADAAESVAAFAAGKAPPNSRYSRVRASIANGFRIDHHDYTDEELKLDPFYQEFLRPAGLFWHANAVLDADGDEEVELSFKRRSTLEPYFEADARNLNTVLAQLRGAARIARQMREAEVKGFASSFGTSSPAVLQIDRLGRVITPKDLQNAAMLPITVSKKRMIAFRLDEQKQLDIAIATATNPRRNHDAGSADGAGWRALFSPQIHPMASRMQDLFVSAAAVAVLIERDRKPGFSRPQSKAIGRAFPPDRAGIGGRLHARRGPGATHDRSDPRNSRRHGAHLSQACL